MTIGARSLALAWFAVCTLTGCYATTIKSGETPGHYAERGKNHWHHGMLAGSQELSGPYDLGEMCADGWAEIETDTSAVDALVGFATFNIYSPQRVSVECAVPRDAADPEPAAGAARGAR